ncbi:histidine kinase [Saccharomonospora sp. NPDC006951]
MAQRPVRLKVSAALQWLGLSGIVLVAAVLCDLLIILSASFDDAGPKGSDLLLLPGILAFSACALWARSQPITASWAGAVVLVGSTMLIYVSNALPYTALLAHISFAETVAGFEMVYFCFRLARGGIAVTTTIALVSATLIAVFGRSGHNYADRLIQTAIGGAILLTIAIALGIQSRQAEVRPERSAAVELLRHQWPLVGGLTLALFLEMFEAAPIGVAGAAIVICSAIAAGSAVLAIRRPALSAVALSFTILLSAAAVHLGHVGLGYPLLGGLPITQVIAGLSMVVTLVRYTSANVAGGYISGLSGAVAVAALVNGPTSSDSSLRAMVLAALLLLGIAVATGLYFKARDSERDKTVRSAVTDAQTAERMALARELHDVVAHHVTGIVVQAQAAKMVGEKDPRIVVDALGQIENAGTEALAAMRRLVRSMRGDAPAGTSEFSEQATTDLAADLRRIVDAGNHRVPTRIELDIPADLPQEVARSALRLVQESLTNVGKHATGATLVRISVRVLDEELHITVADNGNGEHSRPPGGSSGYGLIGMRERVELLRGRLSAGPAPGGGWLVEVWLPLTGGTEGESTA